MGYQCAGDKIKEITTKIPTRAQHVLAKQKNEAKQSELTPRRSGVFDYLEILLNMNMRSSTRRQ